MTMIKGMEFSSFFLLTRFILLAELKMENEDEFLWNVFKVLFLYC
jgi:hypothetical protein